MQHYSAISRSLDLPVLYELLDQKGSSYVSYLDIPKLHLVIIAPSAHGLVTVAAKIKKTDNNKSRIYRLIQASGKSFTLDLADGPSVLSFPSLFDSWSLSTTTIS